MIGWSVIGGSVMGLLSILPERVAGRAGGNALLAGRRPDVLSGMTSFVSHTTVDCRNAYELSEWWRQLLGYTDVADDPNAPGHEECMILDPDSGHRILFIEVPEAKSAKNRLHFDLRPRSGTRDEEIERVRAMGAVEVADRRGQWGPGSGWVVFNDPEGNEFCILRSEAELESAAAGPEA